MSNTNFAELDPFIHQLDSSGFTEDEKPLKQVNQYILLHKLGFGSFAKVFLSVDENTKKTFALKRFKLYNLQHLDAGISQLEREIKAMRRINHPHIIHLHEVLHIESSDTVYLVIDYCDCGSLQRILNNPIPPPDNIIKYIFHSVLQAVSYLHSLGMVHQDIKPSNILLCSDGRVYLADFGLGHSFQSAAMVVGSPAYQAPEAIMEGEFDSDTLDPAKEDVWSLGVTLYQSLFGTLPFTGENVYEIVKNILQNPLEIPEGTEDEISELLRGMLAVMPGERMTVKDVLNSPFFEDVQKVDHFDFEAMKAPKLDSDRKVVKQIAKKCGSNYSFARPKLTAEELLKNMAIDAPADALNEVLNKEERMKYEKMAKMKPTEFFSNLD
ncbi:CAMK family protein kinase [Tritrichomonas foetus]|uniref:CAMK family protein kinase n=1 Tax=Tritrichomonas foetus TaxID=1144522 RepID=A0A1J4KX68_9EUKA|nr:CAMK family protein kinase [Tritrichomonas foetus]|eukprot:OHT14300.1 CAMK family protein kinase [Tritrichomonas foetus]